MLLPGGFEYAVKLTLKQKNKFELSPQYTFSGEYELKDDRLVGLSDNDGHGRFLWKVNSAYMLTLIEQPAALLADYSGAVLFRKRDVLRREPRSARP